MMNQADHDRRSLALHRRICERLRSEPALLDRARGILAHWVSIDGARVDGATARWRELLAGDDIETLTAAACDSGERGRQLRQSSPLACVLAPRERWAFLRDWKALDGA